MQSAADEIRLIVDNAAARLRAIHQSAATMKPSSDVWSIKEIVGHLIDSASNNLHRVVRAQQAPELVFPGYDQNAWVRLQGYQDREWRHLIDTWVWTNRHLADVVERIPASARTTPCHVGAEAPVELQALVDDYTRHLRHHIAQIDERSGWNV